MRQIPSSCCLSRSQSRKKVIDRPQQLSSTVLNILKKPLKHLIRGLPVFPHLLLCGHDQVTPESGVSADGFFKNVASFYLRINAVSNSKKSVKICFPIMYELGFLLVTVSTPNPLVNVKSRLCLKLGNMGQTAL